MGMGQAGEGWTTCWGSKGEEVALALQTSPSPVQPLVTPSWAPSPSSPWSQPDTTSPLPCLPQDTRFPWVPSHQLECESLYLPPGDSMRGADICPTPPCPLQPPIPEHRSGTTQTAWDQVPALLLTSCVIVDKLLNLSVPQFPHSEVETITGPTSEL